MEGVEFNNKQFITKFEHFVRLSKQYSLKNGFMVMMGEFFANKTSKQEMQTAVTNFLNVIDDKRLINAYWLFIPSLSSSKLAMLPQKGILSSIFDIIQQKLPNSINLWNPQRLSIFGKEFIFSQNHSYKYLRKQSLVATEDTLTNYELYANTIM